MEYRGNQRSLELSIGIGGWLIEVRSAAAPASYHVGIGEPDICPRQNHQHGGSHCPEAASEILDHCVLRGADL